MKKFILSVSVTLFFALYVAYVHDLPSGTIIVPGNTKNTAPSSSSNSSSSTKGRYKDGSFTGDNVDAYYGNVQVEAIVQNGNIIDVKFLDYPHDRRTSQVINSQAMPYLTSEAIQVQSGNVDVISGATFTSRGFQHSLTSALDKAKN